MTRWPTKPLGEIAAVVRGVSFSKSQVGDQPRPGAVPILRAGNIQDTLLTDEDLVYVPNALIDEEQWMRRGDIAICMSSGSARVVGKTAYLDNDWRGSVGAFCGIVRFNSRLNRCFGAYWFRSPAFLAWRDCSAKGVNIQNLRHAELEKLPIPMPPLAEQERIVKLLDEADALRKLRAQADRRAADLIPALFHEMFGDPGRNEKGWTTAPLGEILDIGRERVEPSEHPTAEFNYVGLENVEGHTGKLLPQKLRAGATIKSTKNVFHPGEILYGKLRPYLNKVHLSAEDGICSTDIYVLRTRGGKAHSSFVASYLRTKVFVTAATGAMAGANLPRIAQERLLSIPIIVPPLPLQQDFALHAAAVGALETVQANGHRHLDALFQSMLHRAFEGEL